ncbi:putative ankyrin repeat protein RF_0381 [Anneissia japonica]|uniref:putative ankyrin repeat protein RF_0381 n=1 Tax=Anneissia japonica TaxID=1529436 RepID=UPI0014259EAB|nr:putative ankyrin repeat protein RF_0381 [Anneissia japonica]
MDINGSTPLHYAINVPSCHMMKMLIEEDASVNAPNKSGTVPIHIAMTWNDEDMSFFDLLHKSGADIEATDFNGSTVAHYAAWYPAGGYPYCVEFLRNLVNLKRKDMQGNTAVSLAKFIGNHQFVELLECDDESADDSSSSEGQPSEMNEEIEKSNGSDQENTSLEEDEADDSDIDIDLFTPIKEEEIPQFIEQFKLFNGNTLNRVIENPYFDKIAYSREVHYIQNSTVYR